MPPVHDPTDAELVGASRLGDRSAFAAIYQRHQSAVFRYARNMGGGNAVDDVVQEVFLLFMNGLERYDPEQAALRVYLLGIARNVLRARARRSWRLVGLPERDVWPSTDNQAHSVLAAEEHRAVRVAIGRLPERYREVIVLCDLHELEYREAAAVLGVPVGTVRSRLHRARQMLAARLEALSRAPAVIQAESESW